jgi:uncharacterized membrane protein YidH (DUF202 family)
VITALGYIFLCLCYCQQDRCCLLSAVPATAGGGPAGKTLVRTRVEPKTFFANERTFLAWLQIAVLVMMTGLGLLSGSSMMVAGGASAGGVAANCMDSLVCSAARVSVCAAYAARLCARAGAVCHWMVQQASGHLQFLLVSRFQSVPDCACI